MPDAVRSLPRAGTGGRHQSRINTKQCAVPDVSQRPPGRYIGSRHRADRGKRRVLVVGGAAGIRLSLTAFLLLVLLLDGRLLAELTHCL